MYICIYVFLGTILSVSCLYSCIGMKFTLPKEERKGERGKQLACSLQSFFPYLWEFRLPTRMQGSVHIWSLIATVR